MTDDLIRRIERLNRAMNYEHRNHDCDSPEQPSFKRWYKHSTANDQILTATENKFLPRLGTIMTSSEDLLVLFSEQGRQEEHPSVVYAYEHAFLRYSVDDDPSQFEFDFREYP